MRTINLPDETNLPQVEQVAVQAGLAFQFGTDDKWSPSQPDDLHLNMSTVRFIHVSALVQLTVLALESVPVTGGRIRITLPHNEQARRFIASADFIPALRLCPYRQDVRVTTDGEMRGAAAYDQLFPLRWIDRSQTAQFDDWLEHVLSLSSSRKIGLITDDAESLSRLILDELVDNVVRHSGKTHALVGAWTQRKPLPISSAGYLQSEQRAFADARSATLAATHLAVADAGCGVAHSLRTYKKYEGQDLVAHAFDRWSSSAGDNRANGTRGLYRVALLTNDNLGVTTLRSGPHVASHLPSTFTSGRPARAELQLAFPGTFLRVEIPMPTIRRAERVAPTGRIESLQPRLLSQTDLATRDSLRDALNTRRDRDSILVVDLANAHTGRARAQDTITRIAGLAHPGLTAVIGIDVEDIQLRAASEGVRHVPRTSADKEALQPVLCVGSEFEASWWAPQGRGLGLDTADDDSKSDLDGSVDNLLVDAAFAANLVRINATTHLRLTPSGLMASTEEYTDRRIREYLVTPAHGYYLTSSLRAVGGWIDLDAMHHDHPEDIGLIATLLLTKLRDNHPGLLSDRPHLIYEWGVNEHLAQRVARGLQGGRSLQSGYSQRLRQRDMDAKAALGLPRNRPVVILVQGVSAAQSASRLIAHAVRQGYRVGCVLTVVDTRASVAPIELWSQNFPVVAASTVPLAVENPTGRAQVVGGTGSAAHLPEPKHRCSTGQLVTYLTASEAIAVGHFSGSRDRHFTFYIDPNRLLSNVDFRTNLFKWFTEETADLAMPDSETVVVAVNEADDQPAYTLASEFAASLGRRRAVRVADFTRKHLGSDPATASHVLLAWGAMTATSLLAAIDRLTYVGVRRLTVLVVLDQLSTDIARHLNSLRSLRGPGGLGDHLDIKVSFFTLAPLTAYPQQACPMCTQAASDDRHDHEFPLFSEFRAQRDRLALRPWRSGPESGSATGVADPLCEQYGGSSSGIVANALRRRIELTNAADSPRKALAWVRELTRNGAQEDFILSLSTLIVYEPDWLTRAPLSTTSARESLATFLVTFLVPPGQTVMRAHHENARALIALRLVSKSAFVGAFPELVRTFSDRPEFRLIRHLTATIYTRKHLNGSGLLGRLGESLAESRSWCIQNRASQEIVTALETLAEETHARSTGRTEDISTLSLSYRARTASQQLARHDIQSAYAETASNVSQDRAAAHFDAWSRLQRQIRTHLRPLIPELRDRYLLTRQLNNNHQLFDTFFPTGGEGLIDKIVHMLQSAVRRDGPLTPEELDELNAARTDYAALFNRPTLNTLSLLESATDDLFASVGTIADLIERKAQRFPNVTVVAKIDRITELLDIPLPGRYLSDLIDAVLENTQQRAASANEPARVELSASKALDPDRDSRQLTFTSHGVRIANAPRTRPEPGHLALLKARAPLGVDILAPGHDASTNTFELTVVVAGLRHQ